MKYTFSIATFLLIIALSRNTAAQSNNDAGLKESASTVALKALFPHSKKSTGRAKAVDVKVSESFIRCNNILSEIKVMEVKIQAVRHFTHFYKDVSDVKWFITEGGYIAIFQSTGVYTKVAYDFKGRWFYNLLEYTEAGLAFDIRDLVMRNYYDNDIFLVHQFEFDHNKTVYLIEMQDKQSNLITIKVCDGEIEDITEKH